MAGVPGRRLCFTMAESGGVVELLVEEAGYTRVLADSSLGMSGGMCALGEQSGEGGRGQSEAAGLDAGGLDNLAVPQAHFHASRVEDPRGRGGAMAERAGDGLRLGLAAVGPQQRQSVGVEDGSPRPRPGGSHVVGDPRLCPDYLTDPPSP